MTILLYQFDCLEAFPILESQTTMPALASTNLEQRSSGRALRVTAEDGKHTDEAPRLVLALPPRMIEGRPEQLILRAEGDGSGSQLAIETVDDRGTVVGWELAALDFEGQRDCLADVDMAQEKSSIREADSRARKANTLQFFRLVVLLRPEHPVLDIVLHTLHISGDVRLIASGIARP